MPQHRVDRVYLARHGQTALNADGRLRGLSDPPLDDVGLAEVRRLAAELAGYTPTVVISSPLRRAVSTAKAIGGAATIPVVVDTRLVDRDYGTWTGQPRAEVEQRFGSVDDAPGVESAVALAARALAAWTELTSEYQDGPLVMVSHDAFNTALLHALDASLASIGQRTACYNQLSRVDGRWRVDFHDRKPE
jgi:broad specificity phosphatase PhoE